MTQTCLFSVASGTPDAAEVDPTKINGRTGGCSYLLVFRFQIDTLEQGTFEVLCLIQSWRNSLVRINQIPPEILTLIPDFWDATRKYQDLIALTPVCRAWRKAFISRSSLWTGFNLAGFNRANADKTRVYLEHSKSSPINISLWLGKRSGLSPHDPFLQIAPHVIGRLKSLVIKGNTHPITTHLSHPAPLLEYLSIHSTHGFNSLMLKTTSHIVRVVLYAI